MRLVYRQVRPLASRALSAGAALGLILPLLACASAPKMPMLANDVTGTVPQAAPIIAPLSTTLTDEDWAYGRAAMALALDPSQSGQPTTWENPDSGARGGFTPVGMPYAAEGGRVCRAFLAELNGSLPPQHLQGRGCRDSAGMWSAADVKPWKS